MPIKLSRAKVGFSHLVFSSFFFSLMLKSEVVHQRNAVFFYTYCTRRLKQVFGCVTQAYCQAILKCIVQSKYTVGKKEWPVKLPVALLNQQD